MKKNERTIIEKMVKQKRKPFYFKKENFLFASVFLVFYTEISPKYRLKSAFK